MKIPKLFVSSTGHTAKVAASMKSWRNGMLSANILTKTARKISRCWVVGEISRAGPTTPMVDVAERVTGVLWV